MVFHAQDIDTAKTKKDKPIVFSEVKVNEGGCYDNTTGVFTTTVPGTYVFTATVESGKENSVVRARITVDDTYYTTLRGSYTSSASGSVSVQLGLGQKVWVTAWNDVGDYSYVGLSFTGVLVQPQL